MRASHPEHLANRLALKRAADGPNCQLNWRESSGAYSELVQVTRRYLATAFVAKEVVRHAVAQHVDVLSVLPEVAMEELQLVDVSAMAMEA